MPCCVGDPVNGGCFSGQRGPDFTKIARLSLPSAEDIGEPINPEKECVYMCFEREIPYAANRFIKVNKKFHKKHLCLISYN